MPNQMVPFNIPSPYQAQLEELSNRQKLAEIMQAQSFQPAERFSYKGIEARTSPLTGLAKALQMYMGMKERQDITKERAAIGERYQSDLVDTLSRAQKLSTGTPEIPAAPAREVPESSYVPTGMDLAGDINPPARTEEGNIIQPAHTIPGRAAVPAVEPNPQAAVREYFRHPATVQLGMAEMQRLRNQQEVANALKSLGVGAPSASGPQALAAEAAAGGAPGPTQAAAARIGAPPFDPRAAALLASGAGNPAIQTMAGWMQKNFEEANKPTDKIRELRAAGIVEGSPAWNAALTDVATQGGIWRRDPRTGALSLAPGYAAGQGEVTGATEAAKAGYDLVDVPVTLPNGTQVIQKMTRAQAVQRLGGAAPQQSGETLQLTAPTEREAEALMRQLHGRGITATVRVQGQQPAGGFGVADPVKQKALESGATASTKAIVEKLEASHAGAQASEERIRQVQGMRPILDAALIAGPGATTQTFLGQVSNKLFGAANAEELANTRQLITGLSEMTLASRGALKGQGTITENETLLLQKARSAPDNLTVPEYKRLFDIFERQDKRAIQQHEEIRKRAGNAGIQNIDFWRVDAPSVAPGGLNLSPAAQDVVNRARGAQ